MKYTYRQLFTKHLPEPYRSQAIANAVAQDGPNRVDDPSETSGIDPDNLDDALSSAFAWSDTPEGHDYWSNAAKGLFPAARTLKLETGKRYLTRDGREASVTYEDFDYAPGSCFRFDGEVDGLADYCWSATGRFDSQRENPLDLVEEIAGPPAPPTYRLLNLGEIIREGDEVNEGAGWIPRRVLGFPLPESNRYPHRRLLKSYEDA